MPSAGDIGRRFGPYQAAVSRERLLRFAEAIGEERPHYRDPAAARQAGYRDVLAPPTFPFAVMFLDLNQPLAYLEEIGVDLTTILHAEQVFRHERPICAGDTLTFNFVIKDVIAKPEKNLTFIVDVAEITNQEGKTAAILERNVVVRLG